MKLTNRGKCLQYKAFAFLIYVIPMTVLFLANVSAYTTTEKAVGFWGFVLIAFIILMFKNTIVEAFKKRAQVSLSAAVLIISVLFNYMASELTLIAAVSLVAAILASFVEVVADTYDTMSYKLVDGVKVKNPAVGMPDKEAWAVSYGVIVTGNKNDGE